jgi:hypothetical protein
MRKLFEDTDENSCFRRAKSNEMVFVLIGRDKVAPWAIYFWCVLRCLIGKNRWVDGQIQEALLCANTMRRERVTWGATWTAEPTEKQEKS